MRDLLKKPFNPYIYASLTDKRKIQKLNDAQLQQIAGWTKKSQMQHVYFGNEAADTILKGKGILPKEGEPKNILKSKECPECRNPNQLDAPICSSCKMVLSYHGYADVIESEKKKAEEVQALKDQISKMQEDLKQYDTQTTKVKEYMDAMGSYIERQKEQQDFREREQKKMVETLDMVVPGWREPYFRERHKLAAKDRQKLKEST
jgi:5'-3' exonuclease